MRVREQIKNNDISNLKNNAAQQVIFMKKYHDNISLVLKQNNKKLFHEIMDVFSPEIKKTPNYIFQTMILIGESPNFKEYIDIMYDKNLDPNPEYLKGKYYFYGHDLLTLLLDKKYDNLVKYLIEEKKYPKMFIPEYNYLDIISYDKDVERFIFIKDLGFKINNYISKDLYINIKSSNIENLFKITDILEMSKEMKENYKNDIIKGLLYGNIPFKLFDKLKKKYNFEITSKHDYLLQSFSLKNLTNEKTLYSCIANGINIKKCLENNSSKEKNFLFYLIDNINNKKINDLISKNILPDFKNNVEVIDEKIKLINKDGLEKNIKILKGLMKIIDLRFPFLEENEEHNNTVFKKFRNLSFVESDLKAVLEKDFLNSNLTKETKENSFNKKKRL